jgi:RNA polymerase sigma-70 factor (ECF subfamily)
MDSDEALYERWIAGDLAAFDRLYERYERPLFGFVRAFVREQADAEDVLHEAFMAVLRERDRRSEVRSFRAWIYQIARNLCLNCARSRKRAGRAAGEVQMLSDALVQAPQAADAAMEGQQLLRALEQAALRLPEALAEVYRLRAAGVSYEEAASVLGVPVGTVKSRVHEMVKRLREEMVR